MEEAQYYVEDVSSTEWTNICSKFLDYNYEQSKYYANSRAKDTGATIQFVKVTDENGALVGAACIRAKSVPFTGLRVNYISGGPLLVTRETTRSSRDRLLVIGALKRFFVEDKGQSFFFRLPIYKPHTANSTDEFLGMGLRSSRRFRTYRTILVDVAVDQKTMMASLAGKWRTDLKYAIKSEVKIEYGHGKLFHDRFMNLFGEMRDTKNFDVNVDPRDFFNLPEDEIGLKILIATKNGEDIAGHVVSMLGETSVYLFGATNEVGRKSKAGYLLNWEAMLLAGQQGLKWYDLGGIDPVGNPGVYRFKKKMGGMDVTALGPYESIPQNIRGAILNMMLDLRESMSK